ncbi:MAG: NUDIX hydrolase [candidate division Zixibacteria bacterium]|nr:NUDIX hydrolase [candidate division Zixibacteria bacterium]
MSSNHNNFNTEKLFKRKDENCGFKFCPYCSNKLISEHHDGKDRLKCSSQSCDYIFYQNPVPSAGAVIVENDKILLVKRAHPPKLNWWCFPAGFMEWDEHPSQTCIRELKEETGLDVKVNSLFDIYSGNDDPRTNAILILYICDRIGGELTAADDALEVKFFHLDDLPEKIAFESHIQALADYNNRFRNKT